MRKSIKAALLVAFLLVIIMAGIAWASFQDCPGRFRRSYHTILLRDEDFIDKDVRFRIRGEGTTLSPNGLLGGFTIVRASDCVEATSGVENEHSPIQTADEMESKVRAATRVIESGPLTDSQGEILGKRTVLLVKTAKGVPSIEIVTVYKDQGAKLYLIRSTSLAHALAYERLLQSGYRIGPDGYLIARGK